MFLTQCRTGRIAKVVHGKERRMSKSRISYTLSARRDAARNGEPLATVEVVYSDGTRKTYQGLVSQLNADVLANAVDTLAAAKPLRGFRANEAHADTVSAVRCHRCSGSHAKIDKCVDCGQPVGVIL